MPGSVRTTGRRSARESVTSIRTRRALAAGTGVSLSVALSGWVAASVSVSRRWKSRPGTSPWLTAFAASSAVMSVIVSLTSEVYGYPQSSSRCETSRRASRAPRGVEVNPIANSWEGVGLRVAPAV